MSADAPEPTPPAEAPALPAGVREALEELDKPKPNWLQGILTLGVTAAVFVAGELIVSTGLQTLGGLIVVLALHELGHFVAMKAFGYRDMRVFFIPLFGAAAAGRKLDATSTQRAIVALAGPVPSLLLAVVLLVVGAAMGESFDPQTPLGTFVSMLLAINFLNLIPIEPLDGGEFLRAVLMDRLVVARVGLRIVFALGMMALAWVSSDWVLLGFGAFLVLGSHYTYRVAVGARRLAAELRARGVRDAEPTIPAELHPTVAGIVRETFPVEGQATPNPKLFASQMHALWQQAHARPPRAAYAVALCFGYALFGVPACWLAHNVARNGWNAGLAAEDAAASSEGVTFAASATPPVLPATLERVVLPPAWKLDWAEPKDGYLAAGFSIPGEQRHVEIVFVETPPLDVVEKRIWMENFLGNVQVEMTLKYGKENVAVLRYPGVHAGRETLRFDYADRSQRTHFVFLAIDVDRGAFFVDYREVGDEDAASVNGRALAFFDSLIVK